MKSLFAAAGLATAFFAAAPLAAQAQPHMRNGDHSTVALTVTKTQVRLASDYDSYRAHRGHIMPLARVVRQLERRSGATVTDIKLAANGKVYKFEGVTARGFIVHAKADAYTGAVSHVQFTKFRPHYDPKGMPINRLITKLRNHGFQNFDLVSLKDQRGIYVVRGLNRHGKPVTIRVQARTGRILSRQPANVYHGPAYLQAEYRDFDKLLPALEAQRFNSFTNVVAYDDYYSANAHDAKGRNVALLINAYTGAIMNP